MVTAFEWHVASRGRVGCGMEAQARSLSSGLRGPRASRRMMPALEEAMVVILPLGRHGRARVGTYARTHVGSRTQVVAKFEIAPPSIKGEEAGTGAEARSWVVNKSLVMNGLGK